MGYLKGGIDTTVKQLKDFLEQYADDLEIEIGFHHRLAPINYASHGVDMDTNKVSVWLCYMEEGD